MSALYPRDRHPCRWPGCVRSSDYHARDDRAAYGHLCSGHHWGLPAHEREREVMLANRTIDPLYVQITTCFDGHDKKGKPLS